MPAAIAAFFAIAIIALAVYIPAIRQGMSDLKRQVKLDAALGCEQ